MQDMQDKSYKIIKVIPKKASWFKGATGKTMSGEVIQLGLNEEGRLVKKSSRKFSSDWKDQRLPIFQNDHKMKEERAEWMGNRYYFCEDDKLEELVKKCVLYDKNDNVITEANPYDRRDAFFNHPDLRPKVRSGNIVLENDLPVHQAIWQLFKDHPDSTTDQNSQDPTKRFIIMDGEAITKKHIQKTTWKMEANKHWANSSQEKLIIVCNYLGRGVNFQSTPETVNQTVDFLIDSDPKRFVEVMELDDDTLQIAKLVNDAFDKKILKRKNNFWRFKLDVVGQTKQEVISYFQEIDNQPKLTELQGIVDSQYL